MGLLDRLRRRLPDSARPALGPEERVVAWATTSAGGYVVVTNHGLWLPDAESRLGWHEIHKAVWSGRALTVSPARRVDVDGPVPVYADAAPVSHTLLDPDRVPVQVRDRVTRSVAYSSHHPVPGVRVVARRIPGTDGLTWAVRYDEGVDPAAPEVQQATADLVAQARAEIGE